LFKGSALEVEMSHAFTIDPHVHAPVDAGMIRFLARNPVFADLSTREHEALCRQLEVRTLRRRQMLWTPTDEADKLFLVRSGVVRVSRSTEDGRELSLGLFTKHDVLGIPNVFVGGPQGSEAEATSDAVVYVLDRKVVERLAAERPSVARALFLNAAQRRNELEDRLAGLIYASAHARLAALYLSLAERFGVRDSRGVILNLKLTHRETSTLIGATRETVSFAILAFRKEGLVRTEGRRVILTDLEGLQRLASQPRARVAA
jgi:CRP/FNR family transcriptional regulator